MYRSRRTSRECARTSHDATNSSPCDKQDTILAPAVARVPRFDQTSIQILRKLTKDVNGAQSSPCLRTTSIVIAAPLSRHAPRIPPQIHNSTRSGFPRTWAVLRCGQPLTIFSNERRLHSKQRFRRAEYSFRHQLLGLRCRIYFVQNHRTGHFSGVSPQIGCGARAPGRSA